MVGTGLTPEGIEQNDMMYELMNEMGYRTKALNSVELEDWIKYYALRRYGGTNDNIVKAWKLLIHSVYNCTYYCIGYNHRSVFVRRPTLRIATHIWYDPGMCLKRGTHWSRWLRIFPTRKHLGNLS